MGRALRNALGELPERGGSCPRHTAQPSRQPRAGGQVTAWEYGKFQLDFLRSGSHGAQRVQGPPPSPILGHGYTKTSRHTVHMNTLSHRMQTTATDFCFQADGLLCAEPPPPPTPRHIHTVTRADSPLAHILSLDTHPHTQGARPCRLDTGRNLGPPRGASRIAVLSHLNLIQAGGSVEGLTSALTAASAARASIWATACPRQSQQQQHNNSVLRGSVRGGPGSEPGKGVPSLTPPSHLGSDTAANPTLQMGKTQAQRSVTCPWMRTPSGRGVGLAAWLQSLCPKPGNKAKWSRKGLP